MEKLINRNKKEFKIIEEKYDIKLELGYQITTKNGNEINVVTNLNLYNCKITTKNNKEFYIYYVGTEENQEKEKIKLLDNWLNEHNQFGIIS